MSVCVDDVLRRELALAFGTARAVAVDFPLDPTGLPFVPVEPSAPSRGALLLAPAGRVAARIEEVRPTLSAGCTLALLRPPRAGGVRGVVRRWFAGEPEAPLEDACEGLLLARCKDVRARTLDRDGWLAWGVVR